MSGTKRYFVLWVLGMIFAACGVVLSVFTAIVEPFNELLMCFAIAFDGIGCGMSVCTFVLGKYISDEKIERDYID